MIEFWSNPPHPEKNLQAYNAFAASTFHSIHFLRFVWSVDYIKLISFFRTESAWRLPEGKGEAVFVGWLITKTTSSLSHNPLIQPTSDNILYLLFFSPTKINFMVIIRTSSSRHITREITHCLKIFSTSIAKSY